MEKKKLLDLISDTLDEEGIADEEFIAKMLDWSIDVDSLDNENVDFATSLLSIGHLLHIIKIVHSTVLQNWISE